MASVTALPFNFDPSASTEKYITTSASYTVASGKFGLMLISGLTGVLKKNGNLIAQHIPTYTTFAEPNLTNSTTNAERTIYTFTEDAFIKMDFTVTSNISTHTYTVRLKDASTNTVMTVARSITGASSESFSFRAFVRNGYVLTIQKSSGGNNYSVSVATASFDQTARIPSGQIPIKGGDVISCASLIDYDNTATANLYDASTAVLIVQEYDSTT
jgi:hypothetical protein